ncbi:PUX10, partial [Symbiodinium necroappetens]
MCVYPNALQKKDFDQWFLDRFGPPAPSFCKTSFGDAVQRGLNEGMLVMAWFHEADGPATERFCREVLQNELVLGLLQDTFLLWAGDVCRFEPSQIARLMGLTKFPSLVLLQPLANGFDTN